MSKKNKDVKQILANNLTLLLEQKNLSARGFGVRLKTVSSRTVSHIMTGASAAKIDTIEEIAKELGVEPWELLHPKLIKDRTD